MKLSFPDRVDTWPLTMSVTERNGYETTDECTLVDVMYAIRELQKYVLQLAASVSPVDVDEVNTATAVDVSALSTAISVLQSQISALPVYLAGSGAPASSLGKNGDVYWDSTNSIQYVKLGGTWRQVA